MSTRSQRRFDKIFGVRRFGGYPVTRRKSADPSEATGFAERLPLPPDATFREQLADQASRRDDMTNGDDDNGDANGAAPMFGESTRHLSELATLLSEATGNEVSRAAALRWLLQTKPGQTLAMRTSRLHKKDQTMTSHDEILRAVAKRYGVRALCKSVVEHGVTISEHLLTKLITEHAERSGTTFARMFSEQNEQGVILRKAIDVAKQAQWSMAGVPLSPILPTWTHEPNINDPKDALEQLNAMAQRMKDAAPDGMTFAQAFARTYSDPKNARLAALERAQSRAKLPLVGGRAVGE
jgi:hypothetical protein